MDLNGHILRKFQIEAADRLHDRLEQWKLSDAALDALNVRFPELSDSAMLLKVVAINALYSTNVFALIELASHVRRVLEREDVTKTGEELIENIAVFKPSRAKKERRNYSFASKFAHFFIDAERFPVMDSFAVAMLKFHLGTQGYRTDDGRPYFTFLKNLSTLRERDGLGNVANRSLDHYLWLAGEYRAFDGGSAINSELAALLNKCKSAEDPDLKALVGGAD